MYCGDEQGQRRLQTKARRQMDIRIFDVQRRFKETRALLVNY